MQEFASLWTEATHDAEQEGQQRALANARVASAGVWPFLMQATSHADYANRRALAMARYETAAERFGISAEAVAASYDADFNAYAAQRVAALNAPVRKRAFLVVAESDDSDDSGDSGTQFYVVDKDTGKDVGGPYDSQSDAQDAISGGDFGEDSADLSVADGPAGDSGGSEGDSGDDGDDSGGGSGGSGDDGSGGDGDADDADGGAGSGDSDSDDDKPAFLKGSSRTARAMYPANGHPHGPYAANYAYRAGYNHAMGGQAPTQGDWHPEGYAAGYQQGQDMRAAKVSARSRVQRTAADGFAVHPQQRACGQQCTVGHPNGGYRNVGCLKVQGHGGECDPGVFKQGGDGSWNRTPPSSAYRDTPHAAYSSRVSPEGLLQAFALPDGVDPIEWVGMTQPGGSAPPEKPDEHNGVPVGNDEADDHDHVARRKRANTQLTLNDAVPDDDPMNFNQYGQNPTKYRTNESNDAIGQRRMDHTVKTLRGAGIDVKQNGGFAEFNHDGRRYKMERSLGGMSVMDQDSRRGTHTAFDVDEGDLSYEDKMKPGPRPLKPDEAHAQHVLNFVRGGGKTGSRLDFPQGGRTAGSQDMAWWSEQMNPTDRDAPHPISDFAGEGYCRTCRKGWNAPAHAAYDEKVRGQRAGELPPDAPTPLRPTAWHDPHPLVPRGGDGKCMVCTQGEDSLLHRPEEIDRFNKRRESDQAKIDATNAEIEQWHARRAEGSKTAGVMDYRPISWGAHIPGSCAGCGTTEKELRPYQGDNMLLEPGAPYCADCHKRQFSYDPKQWSKAAVRSGFIQRQAVESQVPNNYGGGQQQQDQAGDMNPSSGDQGGSAGTNPMGPGVSDVGNVPQTTKPRQMPGGGGGPQPPQSSTFQAPGGTPGMPAMPPLPAGVKSFGALMASIKRDNPSIPLGQVRLLAIEAVKRYGRA